MKEGNVELHQQVTSEIASGSVVHVSVGQDVIITTADSLSLRLIRHERALKDRTNWATPFGVFLSLLAAFVTADFKKFLGLDPPVWTAVFLLGLVISACWLLRDLVRVYKAWGSGGIEGVVEDLKRVGSRAP